MTPTLKGLLVVLAAVLLFGVLGGPGEKPALVVEPTSRIAHDGVSPNRAESLDPIPPSFPRTRSARPVIDAFGPPAHVDDVEPVAQSQPVTAAPTPPSPPPPPPVPVAPPLPFVAVGDWTEDGETVVFLSGPQGTVAVRQGDTVNGVYRVNEARAGALRVTYLPLNVQQELNWRGDR